MINIEIAGQNAFIVYFAEQTSAAVSAQIQAAVDNILGSMADSIVDLVPSYASLLVIFDLDRSDPYAIRQGLRLALSQSRCERCCSRRSGDLAGLLQSRIGTRSRADRRTRQASASKTSSTSINNRNTGFTRSALRPALPISAKSMNASPHRAWQRLAKRYRVVQWPSPTGKPPCIQPYPPAGGI